MGTHNIAKEEWHQQKQRLVAEVAQEFHLTELYPGIATMGLKMRQALSQMDRHQLYQRQNKSNPK